MKIKNFQITFVAFLALSIFSGLFVGDASRARAQSSRVWSDPINLSNSGGTLDPMVVVDTLGIIHALWTDQYDGYKYAQSADGIEWTAPKTAKYPFVSKIEFPDSRISTPTLVPGPEGFIYVLWQTIKGSLMVSQAHSGNLGDPSAWGYQYQISGDVLIFDAAVDHQGVLHVAYIRNTNSDLGPAGVYYVRSSDEGRSWSTEKLLYGSQYFRTTDSGVAHIQVVTSSESDDEMVFVAWDNTTLKRIFMSSSVDSGLHWVDAVQLKGPEDIGGYNTPYNVNMSILGQKVLLTWEVGEPGSSQCDLYGQWSTDGGITWGESNIILDYRSICPLGVDFQVDEEDSIITLMRYQLGNPSLMIWNGTEWSEPQAQREPAYFANPITNETILFGCQYYFMNTDKLFLIGCDQGSSGDIWITSRAINSVDDWSFSTSSWSLPTLLTSVSQPIRSVAYVPDGESLNLLWAQSSLTDTGYSKGVINYSGWHGSQWSPSQGIITGLNEPIGDLSTVLNKEQNRLLLVWSSERDGGLLFSWADASRVNSVSEWESPRTLPSPSQRAGSPDIHVDSSGRIVVVYAVPFNENRGVYIVQSADNGVTWSEPVKVFDAVSSGWEMVNYPKLAMSEDGRLHVLFNRVSGFGNYPEGLYYSQSVDGGMTWSDPEVVSEGSVVWSEIVCYDGRTIHRLWQVDDKSVVANLHEVSQDGGTSWGMPNNVTGASNSTTSAALAVNSMGELHFIQLVTNPSPRYLKEYDLRIKDWRWDGIQWNDQSSQALKIRGEKLEDFIAAGIASNGFISISVIATYYDLDGELRNEIYNVDQFLDASTLTETSLAPIIPTPLDISASPQPANEQPTQVIAESTITPLSLGETPSTLNWNLAGIFLVLVVLGSALLIFLRRSGSKERK